jgi:hypothetical protein
MSAFLEALAELSFWGLSGVHVEGLGDNLHAGVEVAVAEYGAFSA